MNGVKHWERTETVSFITSARVASSDGKRFRLFNAESVESLEIELYAAGENQLPIR